MGESEQRARYALAATRDGVWDWNISTGDVYFSSRWAQLLGYEPREVPQRVEFFYTIVHPDDVSRVQVAVEEHLAGLTPVKQIEARLRAKSGEYLWFFDRGEVVARDSDGRPLRMVGTITDITARKQAEARQQLQRDVLELIASGAPLDVALVALARALDQCSDGTRSSIMLLDSEGRYLRVAAAPNLPEAYVNAVDGAGIGLDGSCCGRAAYLGETVITEDIATDVGCEGFRDLARAEELRACWSTPILDSSRRVLGTLAMFSSHRGGPSPHHRQLTRLATDVAALAINKHRSEAALRESETRIRLLIQAADVGLWDWDLVTNAVYFSPEWKRQLGYADHELPNRLAEWEGRLHPDDRMSTLAAVSDFHAGRRNAYDVEFRLRHKNGSWRWMFSRADVTRGPDGSPVRMMGCHVDITTRKEAEAARASLEVQLFEAQKMQAIGTLAGGIAHDFNNILASTLVNLTLARREVGEGHRASGSLDLVMKSSLRARDLISQILAFSRREPPKLVRAAVGPVVAEALELLRSTLPAGVQLESDLEASLHALIAPAQVGQVVVNLCTNAWQAMGDTGGRITVGLNLVELRDAEARRVGLSRGGMFVCVRVSDTGAGIDAAIRSRIFEPFFTTKPVGHGTGLGLSVAHGIMAGHGGAISADSAPGRGSTFHLYFPALDRQVLTEATPAAAFMAPQAGHHVLYVDDDEIVAIAVERLVRSAGYRSTCFTRAVDGLEAIRTSPTAFDIVVADYNMPDMSGLEIAREAHRLRPTLPVVISSGYVSEELRRNATRVGARAVLSKQDTFEELVPLLQALLSDNER